MGKRGTQHSVHSSSLWDLVVMKHRVWMEKGIQSKQPLAETHGQQQSPDQASPASSDHCGLRDVTNLKRAGAGVSWQVGKMLLAQGPQAWPDFGNPVFRCPWSTAWPQLQPARLSHKGQIRLLEQSAAACLSSHPLLLKDPVPQKTEVWPHAARCPPSISVISSGFRLPWFLTKPGK